MEDLSKTTNPTKERLQVWSMLFSRENLMNLGVQNQGPKAQSLGFDKNQRSTLGPQPPGTVKCLADEKSLEHRTISVG